MRIRIFSTPASLARSLGREVRRLVEADPTPVLGLPTGRTPIPFYRELVRLYRNGRIDLSHLTTVNLDEFLGTPPDHPGSYHAYMRRHLFDHVNIPARRRLLLDGRPADVAGECARYDRAIERLGGIDLQILGLGTNGHVGFNEPAAALAARTHRTTLRLATRRANAPLFGHRPAAVPRQGLSMGMATILHARRIILVATGTAKAACVRQLIHGPVTTRLPASFLQLHPAAEIWLDAEAGARLRKS